MNKLFSEYQINDVVLKNRFVVAPMCTNLSDDGYINDDHFAHYSALINGGASLIIIEACAILENGRIKNNDIGIWDDKFIPGLKKLVNYAHKNNAKIGIQLAHAGRKSLVKNYKIYGATNDSFDSYNYQTVHQIENVEIEEVVKGFELAATRALLSGFDIIELHGAHGYLISQFLSPLTNTRTDKYGFNRGLFLDEIIEAVIKVWPSNLGLLLRISANDYHINGNNANLIAQTINSLGYKESIDLIHVSSGGLTNIKPLVYQGYQLNDAILVKELTKIPTICVGLLEEESLLDYIANQDVDLVAMGRVFLRNPYYINNLIKKYTTEDISFQVLNYGY